MGVLSRFDYDLEGNYGTSRQDFNAVVLSRSDQQSFWAPFKAVVSARANASGLMCSYNAVNGVPSCMNAAVNNDLVRDQWGTPGRSNAPPRRTRFSLIDELRNRARDRQSFSASAAQSFA